MYILGLDPSLKKTGYVVFDLDKPDKEIKEKGLLKTSTKDGLLILRLIKQTKQIENIINKYNISYIGMESPYFGAGSTEILFALNQFLHKMFLEKEIFIVCFPPLMLKKLVFPEKSAMEITKSYMIDKAKTILNLQGKRLAEDVADAYWAGVFGKKFYLWYNKFLKDEELSSYELEVFKGKHVYSKGKQKGYVEYKGIIYRENELFYDFKKIKRSTSICQEQLKNKK
jgi:Holliday junction resolvasome RuvABC endonuclease subunit